MSPRAKITEEMILNTVSDITREAGFESVGARSILDGSRCSTWPIFTCYENMDKLKREFPDYTYEFYNQYVRDSSGSENINSRLVLPVSYIKFAKEETHLFRLLFVDYMELSMEEPKDFYKEAGSERREKIFSDVVGAEPEPAKAIFMDLFLYSYDIAVLAAAQKVTLDRNRIEKVAANILIAFIRQEKPDWTLSLQRYVRINKNIGV